MAGTSEEYLLSAHPIIKQTRCKSEAAHTKTGTTHITYGGRSTARLLRAGQWVFDAHHKLSFGGKRVGERQLKKHELCVRSVHHTRLTDQVIEQTWDGLWSLSGTIGLCGTTSKTRMHIRVGF
jgi:hypothetical protein